MPNLGFQRMPNLGFKEMLKMYIKDSDFREQEINVPDSGFVEDVIFCLVGLLPSAYFDQCISSESKVCVLPVLAHLECKIENHLERTDLKHFY